jgi:hypothetical protein
MHSLIIIIPFLGIFYLLRKEWLDEVREFKVKNGFKRSDYIRYKYRMLGRKPTISEYLSDYFWRISK